MLESDTLLLYQECKVTTNVTCNGNFVYLSILCFISRKVSLRFWFETFLVVSSVRIHFVVLSFSCFSIVFISNCYKIFSKLILLTSSYYNYYLAYKILECKKFVFLKYWLWDDYYSHIVLYLWMHLQLTRESECISKTYWIAY